MRKAGCERDANRRTHSHGVVRSRQSRGRNDRRARSSCGGSPGSVLGEFLVIPWIPAGSGCRVSVGGGGRRALPVEPRLHHVIKKVQDVRHRLRRLQHEFALLSRRREFHR